MILHCSNLNVFLYKNHNRLKKNSIYSKKVSKNISQLKILLEKNLSKLPVKKNIISNNISFENCKKPSGYIIQYSICFSISSKNSYLFVNDSFGKLYCNYSSGLLGLSGKQKKNRLQVLLLFFNELKKLKMSVLKNYPVVLHLYNVGSFKNFIIKKLKKIFFIRSIKNYQIYSFNGCRKKKKLRK